MNIQILANSNIKLPPNLSHLDIGFGYSYITDNLNQVDKTNSFMAKGFSKLDHIFNRIKPLTKNQQSVVEIVAEKTQFLQSSLSKYFTKDLKVQMNIESSLNRQFKRLAAPFFGQGSTVMKGLDSNTVYALTDSQHVTLGTEVFASNLAPHFVGFYLNFAPLEEVVSFAFFHEVAHNLETYNTKNFGRANNKIYDALTYLELIESNKNTFKDISLIGLGSLVQLKNLYAEIYADTGAILLQRNYEVEKGIYNNEKFGNYINAIGFLRKKEKAAFYSATVIPDHYTVPGLEVLQTELKNNPVQILNEEDIHNLAQKVVTQGIAATIQKVIAEIPEYQPMLANIFNPKNTEEDLSTILMDTLNKPKKFKP